VLLRPPSFAVSDLKLIVTAIALIVAGSLGLTTALTGASANGQTSSIQGTVISWNFDAVAYTSTNQSDANGHVLHFCAESVTDCTSAGMELVAFKMPAAGSRSYTADTVDPIARGGGALSADTYRVQMVLWTNGVVAPVGNLLTLNLGDAGDSSTPTDEGDSSTPTESTRSTPPVQITFSTIGSASQLLAGNRNFTFEGDDVSDVLAVRVNGKSLPIFNREEDSFDVKLPKLGPGSYSVIIYTATDNWEIPGAIVIGELLPEIRKEAIEETFERSSSELPASAKREIRDMIEATPNLRKITVTAIAVREIVRQDGNKLARARAESALDFIKKLEPGVIIETKLVYRGDTDLSSRGLVFRVAQKKS
jgi:hypothetical protein